MIRCVLCVLSLIVAAPAVAADREVLIRGSLDDVMVELEQLSQGNATLLVGVKPHLATQLLGAYRRADFAGVPTQMSGAARGMRQSSPGADAAACRVYLNRPGKDWKLATVRSHFGECNRPGPDNPLNLAQAYAGRRLAWNGERLTMGALDLTAAQAAFLFADDSSEAILRQLRLEQGLGWVVAGITLTTGTLTVGAGAATFAIGALVFVVEILFFGTGAVGLGLMATGLVIMAIGGIVIGIGLLVTGKAASTVGRQSPKRFYRGQSVQRLVDEHNARLPTAP